MRRLIGNLNGKAKWMGTVVLLLTVSAVAQTTEPAVVKPTRLILVSIPDRKLALMEKRQGCEDFLRRSGQGIDAES